MACTLAAPLLSWMVHAVPSQMTTSEQIQRFMVFYKAWLIARALREAGREGVGRVVTPAEYKTVQAAWTAVNVAGNSLDFDVT